jgi:hypothetical protein
MMGVGFSRAAATTKQPENGGEEDECGSEPGYSQHVCGKTDCNIIVL